MAGWLGLCTHNASAIQFPDVTAHTLEGASTVVAVLAVVLLVSVEPDTVVVLVCVLVAVVVSSVQIGVLPASVESTGCVLK